MTEQTQTIFIVLQSVWDMFLITGVSIGVCMLIDFMLRR